MKTWKIFWGLGFVLAAVLLILDAFGIISPIFATMGGITAWQIIGGLFFFAFTVSRIIKLKISEIFVPLSFIFMIFERNIAYVLGLESENIINNWLLFGCAVLLSIGVGILLPKSLKKDTWSFKINHKNSHRTSKGGSGGASTVYVDCEDFVETSVSNKLGETVVHFENEEHYSGGGILTVDNQLGETVVYVPSSWRVKIDISNNLGAVEQEGKGSEDGPMLTINGRNSLGAVSIKFV